MKPEIAMIVCKNCGWVFDGSYCNNCGQSSNTRRLNWSFIIENFEHEILHFEHGIIFTIKEIFMRPGITIKQFLDGKRKKYSHPLTYIAVISVIYFILRNVFVKFSPPANTSDTQTIITNFIYQYYPKIVVVVFIPLAALFTGIFYPGNPYNFVELFSFQCYIRGQFMLFELLVLFINWSLVHAGAALPPAVTVGSTMLFNMLFMGWAQQQFFNDKNYLQAFLKAVGLTVMLMICAAIFAIIAARILGNK